MNRPLAELSGVVLAGGDSRRMGENKAFLQVGGRRLIDRVLAAVKAVTDDVVIVTNTPEDYAGVGARRVRDKYPGTGALGGMYTGLRAAERPYCVVVACDMPFLNVDLLRYLFSYVDGYDAVIPYVGEGEPPAGTDATAKARDLHPLHAVYSKRCLAPIRRAIERDDLRTIAFLPEVDVCFVGRREIDPFDPQCLSFFNANTPEELRQARELGKMAISGELG